MAIEDRICDEQRENQQGCKQKVVGQRWHMDTFRTFSASRDVFAHLACHAHLAASAAVRRARAAERREREEWLERPAEAAA